MKDTYVTTKARLFSANISSKMVIFLKFLIQNHFRSEILVGLKETKKK